MGNDARIVIMLPAAMKKRLTKALANKGYTMSFVVRDLLDIWEKSQRAKK